MRFFPGRLLAMFTALIALATSRAPAQSEPRLPDVLATADLAWTAGKYDDALRGYADVLSRDSSSARALFRVATLLAWRNEFDRSMLLFRKYLRLAPGDADGRVSLARTLAWNGQYGAALALCDSVARENPRNRDAALLGAQVLAWRGNLEGAAARYDRWLSAHPNDAEGWSLLAQVWTWSGRAEPARRALRRALEAEPSNAAALTQLQWTEVELAPSVEPAVSSTNDSDDNRATTYVVRAGFAAPWSARLLADATYRTADLALKHGTSATLRGSSSWTPLDGRWTLRAALGATRLDGRDAPGSATFSRTEPLMSARLSGRIASRLSLGAGVTHASFDETATLIRAGIASTSLEGDADITARPRLSIGGGGGWTRLSGGSGPNTRLAGSGAIRWSVTRALSIAAGVRGFGYDHVASDGYFAPKRYLLAEGSARLHLGGPLGWALESDLGLGHQHITAFDNSAAGRFAQRCSIVGTYRPAPGLEWSVGGSFANVASPTTISSADYRAYSVSIKGRVRL
jgi:tetratricopeptide (TPR) repeat protein